METAPHEKRNAVETAAAKNAIALADEKEKRRHNEYEKFISQTSPHEQYNFIQTAKELRRLQLGYNENMKKNEDYMNKYRGITDVAYKDVQQYYERLGIKDFAQRMKTHNGQVNTYNIDHESPQKTQEINALEVLQRMEAGFSHKQACRDVEDLHERAQNRFKEAGRDVEIMKDALAPERKRAQADLGLDLPAAPASGKGEMTEAERKAFAKVYDELYGKGREAADAAAKVHPEKNPLRTAEAMADAATEHKAHLALHPERAAELKAPMEAATAATITEYKRLGLGKEEGQRLANLAFRPDSPLHDIRKQEERDPGAQPSYDRVEASQAMANLEIGARMKAANVDRKTAREDVEALHGRLQERWREAGRETGKIVARSPEEIEADRKAQAAARSAGLER